ncbi:hypothetical protein [Geotoga petraea]|jgi:hypothetical protein|uniref:N-acetyltransferase domain-containing protein n=1 Tax=Geotoga petraea TaxID=28234 RepID=A0A1G6QB30_9BACT|nr:hypothetical protein [Geotoga petraea]MDK2946836.1 hypothetical protein [Geotoga sp.]SDC88876.1 hypothetical protein SAMN04488588_2013 [Geotoga petraea]
MIDLEKYVKLYNIKVFNFIDFKKKFSKKLNKLLNCFDCNTNDDEYKYFLTENACTFSNLNLAVTYIVFDTKEEVILSYFTLSASTIEVTNSEKKKISSDIPFSYIPALLIGKLAANNNEDYEKLGTITIQIIFALVEELKEKIGFRVLSVDADLDASPTIIEFYKKFNFIYNRKKYFDSSKNELDIPDSGTITMYIDVEKIV